MHILISGKNQRVRGGYRVESDGLTVNEALGTLQLRARREPSKTGQTDDVRVLLWNPSASADFLGRTYPVKNVLLTNVKPEKRLWRGIPWLSQSITVRRVPTTDPLPELE